MPHFYKHDLTKGELSKAVGASKEANEKIEWLQQKWSKEKSDSEEIRLIGPVITGPMQPINLSIIVDNLEYFKENYKAAYKDNQSLKKALQVASLCGSQKITDFLLSEFNANYSTEGYDFVLNNSCASNNPEWSISIAKSMAQKNITMPDGVYAYASFSLIDNFETIFKTERPAPFILKNFKK